MQLLKDSVRYPLFDPQQFEQERQAVIGEMDRNESNPYYYLNQAMTNRMFYQYPSRKSPLGNRQTVKTATTDMMRLIQSRYYVPNNSALVVTGDAKPEALEYGSGKAADSQYEHGLRTKWQTRHIERRHGLVAEARGGTLFLDEVEAMSPRAQVVVLRFVQDQKYVPIGGRVVADGDLRVVAASNADLGELAEHNLFRRDLLFRLRVLQVRLPPLRERAGDVRLLADTFVERCGRQHQRRARRLAPASVARLEAYDWPGNVRELESVILRAVLLNDGDPEQVEIDDPLLSACAQAPTSYDQAFKHAKAQAVAEFEKSYLRRLLTRTRGNISLAARVSRKDRSALNKLVKKYGLRSEEFRVSTSTPV